MLDLVKDFISTQGFSFIAGILLTIGSSELIKFLRSDSHKKLNDKDASNDELAKIEANVAETLDKNKSSLIVKLLGLLPKKK